MRRSVVASFLTGVLVGGIAVFLVGSHFIGPGFEKMRELSARATNFAYTTAAIASVEDVRILQEMRGGHTQEALLMLEKRLESRLRTLEAYESGTPAEAHEPSVRDALERIRGYRRQYPADSGVPIERDSADTGIRSE